MRIASRSHFYFIVILSLFFLTGISFAQSVLKNKSSIEKEKLQIIKVALVLPLTGENKKLGLELYKSAIISQKIANDYDRSKVFAGKFRLQLIPYNDDCDAGKARRVAEKIVAKGDIHFVIGHYCSDATYAALSIYKNKGILHFSPFSSAPNLSEKAPKTFFRLAGRTDTEAQISASWLAEFGKRKKIGVIYEDNLYGKSLADYVINNLSKYNYICKKLSAAIKNPCDQSSDKIKKNPNIKSYILMKYSKNLQEDIIIKELRKQNIGILFYAGYHTGLANLIDAFEKEKWRPVLFGGGSLNNYAFWQLTKGAAKDVLFTLTEDVTRDLSDMEMNQLRSYRKSLSEQALEEGTVQNVTASVARVRNVVLRERADYMRRFYDTYQYYPDTYGSRLHAVTQIIKEISASQNYGLWNKKAVEEDGKISVKNQFVDSRAWAEATAEKIKNFEQAEASGDVGFQTILGSVNFNQIGDWGNAKYFIYKWVDRKAVREWVDLLEDQENIKREGRNGDYIRLF